MKKRASYVRRSPLGDILERRLFIVKQEGLFFFGRKMKETIN
jgi:hypothetical protein